MLTAEQQRTRAQGRAHEAVMRAQREGRLPRIRQCRCWKCGAEARYYHHPRGYEGERVLDVEPYCGPCHAREHPKRDWRKPRPEDVDEFRPSLGLEPGAAG